MNERRVVVTGIGVISPVGNDLQTFWKSLIEGRSGISRFEAFDSTNFDCKIAGEIRGFEPAKHFKNPKTAKRTDRFTQFAMAGTKLAIEDSGIDLDKLIDAGVFISDFLQRKPNSRAPEPNGISSSARVR